MAILDYCSIPFASVYGFPAKVILYAEDTDGREPEDVYGFDDPEREFVQAINERRKKGGAWAWADYRLEVSVEIGLETLIAEDHTLGCSYDSAQAFMQTERYQKMLESCTERIQDRIDALRRALVGGQ